MADKDTLPLDASNFEALQFSYETQRLSRRNQDLTDRLWKAAWPWYIVRFLRLRKELDKANDVIHERCDQSMAWVHNKQEKFDAKV
jgi:hypothetical protein